MTYLPTAEGWLYVAGVLDRCSRRVLGLAMAARLDTALPEAALRQALARRADGPRACSTTAIAASITPAPATARSSSSTASRPA